MTFGCYGDASAMAGNQLSLASRDSRGSATARQPSRLGRGTGGLAGGTTASEMDKPDVVTGLNPVNRQSGSVVSEALIEEYSAVVEGYFKAITTRNPPNP